MTCCSFLVLKHLFFALERFYKKLSLLERYFWQCGEQLADLIPYNPLISIFFILTSKLSNYGWNFSDVLVIVLCKIIIHQFTLFNDYVNLLINYNGDFLPAPSSLKIVFKIKKKSHGMSVDWEQIRFDFLSLTEAIKPVTEYISRLTILCYGCNIFFMTFNVSVNQSNVMRTQLSVS